MKIPLMLSMDGPALVIGGGNVGMHKVGQLSKFDVDIILVDREDLDIEIPGNVTFRKAELAPDNIGEIIPDKAALVVSALEDRELNALVADHCRSKGILVNVVDDPELSSVFFTAFSKKGDIVVSITTSGQCPFLARKMREEMDRSMEEWEGWLLVLSPIRCDIKGIDERNKILSEIYENDNI
ncbi:MAG: hypothetical protein KAS67_07455, partial [Thermoplasmata archaeon]|nr:hypothetical protein [Thermoplasmata archaeon]